MIVESVKTYEGWYVLHDFRTFDWEKWDAASDETKQNALTAFQDVLSAWNEAADNGKGEHATYSIVGQKADLLFMIMRPTIKELNQAEKSLNRSKLGTFTKKESSFVSIVEKSSYTKEYDNPLDDPEMRKKLFPQIPKDDYICFYPMSKLRGETYNWFQLPREDRKNLMYQHIKTAKPYTEDVKRIITGATGLDDYEWSVSLFSDDPLQFKKLIYATRFDEVSARYGVFGSFYVGYRLDEQEFKDYFF